MEQINWIEIQELYDSGLSIRDLSLKTRISLRQIIKAKKNGFLVLRDISDSLKVYYKNNKRKHSEETKKKISGIRIKFLKENPDKVPYKLNHSSKESYPEKYFTEVFEKENIKVKKYHHIGLYELDFCILEKKIDIEIDGEQHYTDEKIQEVDKRRNEYLEADGWDVIRIRWSHFKKLSFVEKNEFINELKKFIDNLSDTKPTFNIKIEIEEEKIKKSNRKSRKKSLCKRCGVDCTSGKDRCEKCYRIESRKVERPTLEVLLKDIDELGFIGTGKKYKVSDNAIRKWIKNYKRGLI